MNAFAVAALALALAGPVAMSQENPPPAAPALAWSQLPPLPDAEGFAGAFAGVIPTERGEMLVVAGGTNIVGPKWGAKFEKRWYRTVYGLRSPQGAWEKLGELPEPLAYGAFASTPAGLVCAGGSNETGHSAACYLLSWRAGRLQVEPLPPLPRPCANASCAVVGSTLYVAGGLGKPADTAALHSFWSLDLQALERPWQELPIWPGPARMLAVAGSDGAAFYLFGGAWLEAGPTGQPVRTYLRDCFRYLPGKGWQALAALPRAAVAAPSPAPWLARGEFLVVSGDDGLNVSFAPVEQHPGFPQEVLAYVPGEDVWRARGAAPFSRATAPVTFWQGRYVIPNGEVRPRLRTPEVWSLSPPSP